MLSLIISFGFGFLVERALTRVSRPSLEETARRAVNDVTEAERNTASSWSREDAFKHKFERCLADNAALARICFK